MNDEKTKQEIEAIVVQLEGILANLDRLEARIAALKIEEAILLLCTENHIER